MGEALVRGSRGAGIYLFGSVLFKNTVERSTNAVIGASFTVLARYTSR